MLLKEFVKWLNGLGFEPGEGRDSCRNSRSVNMAVKPFTGRSWSLSIAVFTVLTVLLTAGSAHAQTVISNTGSVQGIAFDSKGNLYYSDNKQGAVYKMTPSQGGYADPVSIVTGLGGYPNPTGLAIDTGGNLYIASGQNVFKETLSGGTYTQSTIANGLTGALSVAIDSSGNFYVTDQTNGGRVLKGTLSGESYTLAPIATGLSFTFDFGALFSSTGLAVDSDGNVFVADTGNARILKLAPSGGSYTQTVAVTGSLSNPAGIAIDSHGNLYIADGFGGTTGQRVYKEIPASGSYTEKVFDRFSGNEYVAGLALNPGGNTLAVLVSGTVSSFGGFRLFIYPTSAQDKATLDLGSVALGSSGSKTATLTFAAAGKLDHASITTQGSAGLDFADAGGGSCSAGHSYAAGDTCTANISFTPKYAGIRNGAVTLLDSSGTQLASIYIRGKGTGPQLTFDAFQYTPIGTALPSASSYTASDLYTGIAVDGAGNVYVSDYPNKRVLKEIPGASGYTETVLADNLKGPRGLAVDGAGNVYVADNDDSMNQLNVGTLIKFIPGASGKYTPTTISTELSYPKNVAVDSSGKVYVSSSDYYGEEAKEAGIRKLTMLPDGSYTESLAVPSSSGIQLAVNPTNGDLYISGYIATLTSNGDYTLSQKAGYLTEGASTFDSAGNLYVTRDENGVDFVIRIQFAADGSEASYTNVADAGYIGGEYDYRQIAVDGGGNVYVTFGANSVQGNNIFPAVLSAIATPPTITFGTVPVGVDTENYHYLTVANIGTDPFTFSVPASGDNPALSPADYSYETTTSDQCPELTSTSEPATLSPDDACHFLDLTFIPSHSGEIDGTLTFTGDDRNVANSIDIVHLTGAGSGGTTNTLTVTVPSVSITAGASSTVLTATIGYNGPAPTGAVTFTLNGGASQTATCATATNAETCSATFSTSSLGAGSYPIAASIAADSNYSAASGAGQLTVTAAITQPQAILSPASGNFGSVNIGSTSNRIAFTLASGGTADLAITSIAISGANASEFQISSNTCGKTLAPSHSCEIDATFAPTAAGNASATLSVVDNAGTQTASLAGAGVTPSAPQAALSPASASFGSVNAGSTSGPQTFTLKNAGNAALPITSIGITGANASQFIVGNNTCGSTLNAGGSCTISVSFKPTAASDFSATLSVVDSIGTQSANLSGSGAASTPADFGIAASPAQQSVQRGSSVSYTIQLVSADAGNPFTNAVTFSASGLPAGASARFSPGSLVPGATKAATSTITVTVPALSAELKGAPPQRPFGMATAAVSLAGILLLWPLRRARRFSLLLLLIASLACAAGITACGSKTTGFAPPGSTSTITVTGTSGSTAHSTTVTLKVN